MDIHPHRLAKALPALLLGLGVRDYLENQYYQMGLETHYFVSEQNMLFDIATMMRDMGIDVAVMERRVSWEVEDNGVRRRSFQDVSTLRLGGVEMDTQGHVGARTIMDDWWERYNASIDRGGRQVGRAINIISNLQEAHEDMRALLQQPLQQLLADLAAELVAGKTPMAGSSRKAGARL